MIDLIERTDTRNELVFIDGSIADIHRLVTGLPRDLEVIVFNGDQDGLAQISSALRGRQHVHAVHIVSHGAPGAIKLGQTVLNAESLDAHREDLEVVGDAIADDGGLFLYGCSVAEDVTGLTFMTALAEHIGVSVAGSNDRTGGAGNWDLETFVGTGVPSGVPAVLNDAARATGFDRALLVVILDILQGYDGNWQGGGDSDSVLGTSGNDVISGGGGDDYLFGGDGNDSLSGDEGNDSLDGGDGADTIDGGAGNDTLVSGVFSYEGGDSSGSDRVDGGPGNDSFIAGAGDDLVGGDGDDQYILTFVGIAPTIFEGSDGGVDSVFSTGSFTLPSNVENLFLNSIPDAPDLSLLASLDGTGNELPNLIIGNKQENTLRGLGGNDSLVGFEGNDLLEGGEGADTLNGGDIFDMDGTVRPGLFIDVLRGGQGDDTYLLATNDLVIELDGEGTDTVRSLTTYTLGHNLENLVLEGDANVNGVGNEMANLLQGNDANNRLEGGTEDDQIRGLDGDDALYGDEGNDFLEPGTGTLDLVDGGDGEDTLRLSGTKETWLVDDLDISGETGRFLASRGGGAQAVEFVRVEWLQFDDVTVRVGVEVDTKELRVNLLSGEWKQQDDESFAAEGNATIGLARQAGDLLRIVGGRYVVDADTISVSGGTVYSVVGGVERALFDGSFTLSLTSPAGTISATEKMFALAGLVPLEFSEMNLSNGDVRLKYSVFDLPTSFSSDLVSVSADTLVIDGDGPRLGIGGTVNLPDVDFELLNLLQVASEDLVISYSALEDELGITGTLSFDSAAFPKVSAELVDEGVRIRDGSVKGAQVEITLDDFEIRGWGFSDTSFAIDTTANSLTGHSSLVVPFKKGGAGIEVDLGFTLEPFQLDRVGINVDLPAPIPVFSTGAFIESLGGALSNLSTASTSPVLFTGNVGLSLARGVAEMDLQAELDVNHVAGSVTGHVIDEKVLQFTGKTVVDWSTGQVRVEEASASVLDGLVTASFGFRSNLNLDITTHGQAQFKLGALRLAGNYLLNFSNDGVLSNDYIKAWGTQEISVLGLTKTIVAGVTYGFDGKVGVFGAEEVPIYSSWLVDESVSDLTVFVGWEQEAVEPVQTRVVVYDDLAKTQVREVIAEADYAANGIAVIDAWSGPKGKVVYIAAPAAGLWDVEVVNPAGLGAVTYSATTSLAENSLSVGTAQATGSTIRVDYSVSDLGEGGNLVFFADTDNVGFDGTPIGEMTATQASGQFQWNSAGFTPGQYWLYALFEDGTRVPLFDYADNAVSVTARTVGSEDDDHLIGTPGVDTLRGLGGNDILEGRYGDDTLEGGTGNDLLMGGVGADTLTGGAGADEISGSLEELDGDRITDFGLGDVIRVDGVRLENWAYDAIGGVVRLGPEAGANAQLNLPAGLDLGKFRLETSAAGSETPWTRLVYGEDADGDGVEDGVDNALGVANPDQRDTDEDGYGNVVDADLNQDLMVDLIDLSLFEEAFGTESADADFNGDGAVDLFDLSMLDALFGQAPGPSAVHPVEQSTLMDSSVDMSLVTPAQSGLPEHALL